MKTALVRAVSRMMARARRQKQSRGDHPRLFCQMPVAIARQLYAVIKADKNTFGGS
jgi:hypothetical protein